MLAKYKNRANVGALVFLVGMVIVVSSVASTGAAESTWDSGNLLAQLVVVSMTVAWFYALWAYAKAKGRSGWWALTGLGTWIGLVILLFLRDKHPVTESR
jgi:hypothetical protein